MGDKGTKRPVTMDHLRSRKKPITATINICMDSALADKFSGVSLKVNILEQDVRSSNASQEMRRELEDARAERDEMLPEVEEQTASFVFRSLGRRDFEALIDAHPVTKEQREKAKKNGEEPLQFDWETFPQALVQACCIDPVLTLDEVKELWESDVWNTAELTGLWEAAFAVNQQRRVVDLGKG